MRWNERCPGCAVYFHNSHSKVEQARLVLTWIDLIMRKD